MIVTSCTVAVTELMDFMTVTVIIHNELFAERGVLDNFKGHKCFQTSPIIGRSEPPPSWRGVTELIYNNGLKYCKKSFGR